MKVNKKEIQRLYAMYNKAVKASEFDLSQVYNAFPTDVAGEPVEDKVLEELREIRGQLFRHYQQCIPDYIPTWYDRVFKGRKPVRNVSPPLAGICSIEEDIRFKCIIVNNHTVDLSQTDGIIKACVGQLANTLYKVNPEAKKYSVGEIMGLTTSFHTFFPSRLRYMAEKNLGKQWYGIRISFIEEVIQSVVRERNRQRNKKELEMLQQNLNALALATGTAALAGETLVGTWMRASLKEDNVKKSKIVGKNFLHSHPSTEKLLNLDTKHVIVDLKDWEAVVRYFTNNPEDTKKL